MRPDYSWKTAIKGRKSFGITYKHTKALSAAGNKEIDIASISVLRDKLRIFAFNLFEIFTRRSESPKISQKTQI
jgi:hypothetical protein